MKIMGCGSRNGLHSSLYFRSGSLLGLRGKNLDWEPYASYEELMEAYDRLDRQRENGMSGEDDEFWDEEDLFWHRERCNRFCNLLLRYFVENGRIKGQTIKLQEDICNEEIKSKKGQYLYGMSRLRAGLFRSIL